MLRSTFFALLRHYTNDVHLAADLWQEIEVHYSSGARYYHNLNHLSTLLQQLQAVRNELADWNMVLFTLFYHDIVYDVMKTENEEQSALLAAVRMQQLGIDPVSIERCKIQILATKHHLNHTDSDTNYFTDADLSVLGQDWDAYNAYAENVRKEYAIYPDELYLPGRKKVLTHFLDMSRIYKTDYFFDRLEQCAKQNLRKELEWLA